MTHNFEPEQLMEFTAPARVNLLGEHTDYTGGFVLPMAIPFYTCATIAPSRDGCYRLSSERFSGVRAFPPENLLEAVGDWSDYPVGVLHALQQRGIYPPPFDLHLRGNVPLGSGLSSSASVEVASALAMLSTLDVTLPTEDIAVLCRYAENDYVHSPCGIMDQFVIAAAKAGHALLLNTRTLTYEHLPINKGRLADTRIVVCNSMVKHSIANGEYGVRHRQVMEGQQAVRELFPDAADLGQATLEQLNGARSSMSIESYLRCRHVITENARVMEARQTLFAGDPAAFGKLMTNSHASQRDDFDCSCDEVDFLVDTALNMRGCYGARLSGGGFGGCTVNLVNEQDTAHFVTALKQVYRQHLGLEADIFVCEPVDGAVIRNAATLAELSA